MLAYFLFRNAAYIHIFINVVQVERRTKYACTFFIPKRSLHSCYHPSQKMLLPSYLSYQFAVLLIMSGSFKNILGNRRPEKVHTDRCIPPCCDWHYSISLFSGSFLRLVFDCIRVQSAHATFKTVLFRKKQGYYWIQTERASTSKQLYYTSQQVRR